ncbi:ATP-binding protein [Parvularcula sp. IMCC14364]|uniref:ATP-binding protein n=1 Tax=Parvularcula sp. IMCC14364 TaxID=3067902 RepID=UPI0027418495|nr:ATP-binding protein [Parvularcula sp. IMCC14364]
MQKPMNSSGGKGTLESITESLRVAPETFDDDFEEELTAADGADHNSEGAGEKNGHDDEDPSRLEADILAQLAAARAAADDILPRKPKPAQPEVEIVPPARVPTQKRSALMKFVEAVAPWVIWSSMACVVASVVYAIVYGVASGVPWYILIGGIGMLAAVLLLGSLTRSFSPLMLTGFLMRRAVGRNQADAVALAGRDILHPLGIAEDILNVDIDARLVTTRDGVVAYANEAYQRIAREAGISGASGLPPRIDRLFGQSGPESRKVFHLCRAAKSGTAAEEIITQMMGAAEGVARLRRFEVSLRPMKDAEEHVAWRLREQEVEDVVDQLSSAYAKYPRPVFGLEPSGRIAWYNEALAEWVGTLTSSLEIGDFILGETNDLISGLWEEEMEPCMARMRRRSGGGMDVSLTPFLRGGIGEGFVCVELQPDTAAAVAEQVNSSLGDSSEAPFGVAMIEGDIGSDAKIADANKVFTEIFGITGNTPLLSGCFDERIIRDLTSAIKNRSANAALARPVEVRLGEGSSAKIMHLHARPVKRRRGSYGKRQTILYSVDVSFQRRMEEDYSQDQKLKTIGHLAGSIAHDFNNLLLVIMGSCEFLMRRHAAGDPSYPDLVLIQQNAQRAKNLTSNLLAFSRKQTLRSEVLSITDLLRDFSPFLNRSLTERVDLNVVNGRALPKVKADKGQLELAVMNLAVNARDAMPEGGALTIETKLIPGSAVADYGYAVLEEVDQVLIEVSDTGSGVPPEIADKIFEPFFTTKAEGKGTGLGLSTVYGIIGQMGGRIFLDNRIGEGATFRIFLPAYEVDEEEEAQEAAAAADARRKSSEPADLTGKGRILIVEDEDGVRAVIVRTLQMCGYEIVEASDGDEALEIIEDDDGAFDLVLTDIMMPEMDGPTLIQEAGDKLGKAKIIFMSGYAETAMRDKLGAIEGAGYLQKPFSIKVVAAKVKEALQT